MDSCFALYKQSFFRYAYDLDDLAAYYIAFDRLVNHWRNVLGERLVEIRYEALVASQEEETAATCSTGSACRSRPACLAFERNAASQQHREHGTDPRKNSLALGIALATLRGAARTLAGAARGRGNRYRLRRSAGLRCLQHPAVGQRVAPEHQRLRVGGRAPASDQRG